MKIVLSDKDLERAVAAGVLQPGQDRALVAFVRQQSNLQPSFELTHIAYYFGAVLIMGAMGWLMTEAWSQIGNSALLALAALYFCGFAVAALLLNKRGHLIPGGLFGTVAVSLTPLLAFAIEQATGVWPEDDTQNNYRNYYLYIQGGWLAMEVATLIVGSLFLRVLRFPFIVMPMAIALWFMSMDLHDWLNYDSSWNSRRFISVWFGLAVLLASLLIDGRSKKDYAFWGYLAGLLAFWGGLSLMDSGSEWGKAGYCAINMLLIATAVLLRRPMFMVFGALGVAGYLGYLSNDLFRDSLLFPIALTLIGLVIIGAGMLYQRNRHRLSENLRASLPSSLLRYLPALNRH